MNLKPYRKAIVAVAGAAIATGLAIWRSEDPATIPGLTEGIVGGITAVLVYLFPNDSEQEK